MQLRGRLFLLGMIAAVALVLGLAVLSPKEPEFQGRKLSEWVEDYGRSIGGQWAKEFRNTTGKSDPADAAILDIGTNALPYLVQWVRYETPAWKGHLYQALNPALRAVNPNWRLDDTKLRQRAEGAQVAFWVLGSDVAAALPMLERIINDPAAGAGAVRAARSLALADARAVPICTKLVTNEQASMPARTVAATSLGRHGTNAAVAIPGLIRCLRSSNELLVVSALAALLRVSDPATVLPETMRLLEDPRSRVRRAAVSAIPAGEHGQPALHALLRLQEDDEFSIRRAAADRIENIIRSESGSGRAPAKPRHE